MSFLDFPATVPARHEREPRPISAKVLINESEGAFLKGVVDAIEVVSDLPVHLQTQAVERRHASFLVEENRAAPGTDAQKAVFTFLCAAR